MGLIHISCKEFELALQQFDTALQLNNNLACAIANREKCIQLINLYRIRSGAQDTAKEEPPLKKQKTE
ncbi:MAG TPA: hypothetical protein VKZ44_00615 [Taishania sp.]|nr:hypothetical protein [Taishania sp.]